MTAEYIEKSWPLFEKYFEKYKEQFNAGGHLDLIEACRWLLAYSFAEQFQEENTRSQAHSFLDGISPISEELEDLQEEMAFNYSNYKTFITFYHYDK